MHNHVVVDEADHVLLLGPDHVLQILIAAREILFLAIEAHKTNGAGETVLAQDARGFEHAGRPRRIVIASRRARGARIIVRAENADLSGRCDARQFGHDVQRLALHRDGQAQRRKLVHDIRARFLVALVAEAPRP